MKCSSVLDSVSRRYLTQQLYAHAGPDIVPPRSADSSLVGLMGLPGGANEPTYLIYGYARHHVTPARTAVSQDVIKVTCLMTGDHPSVSTRRPVTS